MAKQTTVRLPDDLAERAEAVARVKGTSVNALIIDSLSTEIERVRNDKDFTSRARQLLKRSFDDLSPKLSSVESHSATPNGSVGIVWTAEPTGRDGRAESGTWRTFVKPHNLKVAGSNPAPATNEATAEAPSIQLGACLLAPASTSGLRRAG